MSERTIYLPWREFSKSYLLAKKILEIYSLGKVSLTREVLLSLARELSVSSKTLSNVLTTLRREQVFPVQGTLPSLGRKLSLRREVPGELFPRLGIPWEPLGNNFPVQGTSQGSQGTSQGSPVVVKGIQTAPQGTVIVAQGCLSPEARQEIARAMREERYADGWTVRLG